MSPPERQRIAAPGDAFALAGVSARLGHAQALSGIHLRIPQGRWTSIVGPNGAGKSTLLKVLAGLLPHQGEVALLGRPLEGYSARQRARLLAWLGQNETTVDDLTVYDIVMLGRMPHQGWLAAASAQDHAVVEQALHGTETWAYRHRPLSELSGGERQRVLLARVLAVQAPVILMDEPLANLDPPHQTQWLQDAQTLARQGVTVVSVLHEISIALHADALVVMRQGSVLHQGASADAATHRALERVFGERIRIREIDGQWTAIPRLDA